MSASYSYKIADWNTGAFLAELPLTAVTFTSLVQPYGVGTWQAKLPIGDAKILKLDPIYTTEPSAVELVVERTSSVPGSLPQVVFTGPILSRSYDSKNQTLTLGGRESWAYWDRRVIEWDLTYNPLDQGLIFRDLLTRGAGSPLGDRAFDQPTTAALTTGTTRILSYLATDCKYISNACEELAALAGGFEFCVEGYWGVNPVTGARQLRHQIVFGFPQLGARVTPYRWEIPGFTDSYQWTEAGAGLANEVFAIGDDGTGKVRVARSKLVSGRYPLLQTSVSFRPLTNSVSLASAALAAVRRLNLCDVTALVAVIGSQQPEFGVYSLGDDVTYLFKDPRWTASATGDPPGGASTWRLSGWTVTAPDTGVAEQVAHILMPI